MRLLPRPLRRSRKELDELDAEARQSLRQVARSLLRPLREVLRQLGRPSIG